MKFLKRIVGKNFKGRDFDRELNRVTLVTGDNFAGKTAVADLVRIVLLGYSPKHGKQAGRTFGFCGSPTGASWMSTSAVFSDGMNLSRRWELKKGSVKADTDAGEIVPPVLLDASEFLKKSGPEKIRYIFNLIDLQSLGFTPDTVTARLKKDVKVETPTEASEAALNSIVDDIHDAGLKMQSGNGSLQTWIEEIVEKLKERQSKAEGAAEDMAGTIQGLQQLQAAEGLPVVENVTAELEAARKAYQDALKIKQDLEKQNADFQSRSERRKNLSEKLKGLTDHSAELESTRTQQAGLIEATQAYVSATPEILPKKAAADSALNAIRQKIAEVSDQIGELSEELKKNLEGDCCPTCKSKGKAWKANLQKFVDGQVEELDKQIGKLQADKSEAERIAAELQGKLDESKRVDGVNDQKRAEAFSLGRKIKELEAKQNDFTNTKARLEELNDIGQPADPDAMAESGQAVEDAKAEVERLEEAERRQIAGMQDQKRAEEARQKHADKLIEIEVLKLCVKTIASLQKEITGKAFEGFMSKMNLIADGILPGKLVFHDGEIGYFAGASFAALPYFSGTEELLTFAGLSLTLAQSSPIKIVIMDELGRLKGPIKEKLVARMLELVKAGTIDQFIGIDVDKRDYVAFAMDQNFTLIEVQ